MTKSRRNSSRPSSSNNPGSSHRARIFRVLHGICLNLERMQSTAEARRACRDVANRLHTLAEAESTKGSQG